MESVLVLTNLKFQRNLALALRAAANFGAGRVFWTGTRVLDAPKRPRPKKGRGRAAAEEHFDDFGDVRWQRHADPLKLLKDEGYTLVAVELTAQAESLERFDHPEKAAYIFGPEDGHVDAKTLARCDRVIRIPSLGCLNVAASATVVLYDRQAKQARRSGRLSRQTAQV